MAAIVAKRKNLGELLSVNFKKVLKQAQHMRLQCDLSLNL